MSVVRMNITIPDELAKQINKLTRPRKRSQFVSEALKKWIEQIHREKIQKTLEEGYKARNEESRLLTKEFESIDLEGWDEY